MGILSRFFGNTPDDKTPPTGEPHPLVATIVEDPTASMSELAVRALIPITKDNWPYVNQLRKKPLWLPGDRDLHGLLDSFNENASGAYVRCDDPDHPFILSGNQKTRIHLWKQKDMPETADHMIMVESDALGTDQNIISYMPRLLTRGKYAPFVMIFRMSCCGEAAYSMLISYDAKGVCLSNGLDTNPLEIKEGMGKGVFINAKTGEYKVRVANEQTGFLLERIHTLIGEQRQQIAKQSVALTPDK